MVLKLSSSVMQIQTILKGWALFELKVNNRKITAKTSKKTSLDLN